jgi:hypothetical protein
MRFRRPSVMMWLCGARAARKLTAMCEPSEVER